MLKFCVLAALAVYSTRAIPIDNGITGDPEIECGPTSITITFNTKNAFSGHVYVQNRFAEANCRTDGDNTRSVGQIELPFDACGTSRQRSLDPKGVFVRSTVVITFHPRFITKIDRAFTIQCFYMEADKTVSTDIEVSMITTGFQTQVVPMPVCRYEILDAASGGNPVKFALIGMPVFHKWTCDTDTVDTFCMTVHSCVVDDGQGDNLQLIDDTGCAIDRYLMGNLDYPSDLMASKEVHVFKYADRPALFFNCQITILIKEPGSQCAHPQCQEPTGAGDGSGGGVSAKGAAVPKAGAGAGATGTGASGSSNSTAKPATAATPAASAAPAAATTAAAASAATTAAPAATSAAPAASSAAPSAAAAVSALVLRRKRAADHESALGTMDVAQGYATLDIQPEGSNAKLPHLGAPVLLSHAFEQADGICMSTAGFAAFLVLAVAVIAAVITVSACMVLRTKSHK